MRFICILDTRGLLTCYFVVRWLLLCFKREFPESDALRMWEACWARYQTDYFHLFICVAIISVYGEDVVQQDLPADEMLLHFSSLSMHMSGDVVLRKVWKYFCDMLCLFDGTPILHVVEASSNQFLLNKQLICTLIQSAKVIQ